ncbi:hypothetical protein VKT23_020026 [Stygiomarasmius scandens]|uniref:BED-type domain-containing protein n=1 Tax=Marasmiellus scandens TaxID=2682957 RepID=A0ABR1IK71_9AGAR
MTQQLQSRLEVDKDLTTKHIIAASRFNITFEVAANRDRLKVGRVSLTLRNVEDEIHRNHNKMKLWFPGLQAELQHAVAFCVDFEKKTISYGDSLPGFPPPNKVILDVQKWLKTRFKGSFLNLGNSLAHGVQQDTTHFVDQFNWFTTFVPDSKRTATPGNLLNKHSTPTVTVKPLLVNLLNCLEEIAFSDILNATEDDLDVAILDESQPDTPQSENDAVTEDQNASEGLSVLKTPLRLPAPQWRSTHLPPPLSQLLTQPTPAPSQKVSILSGSVFSVERTVASIGNDSSDTEGSLSKKARTSSTSFIAAGSIGISKSNRSEKAAREAADRGEFVPAARVRWKRKIRNVDPFAQFNERKLREARCSKCGKTVKTKTGTDLPRFEEH